MKLTEKRHCNGRRNGRPKVMRVSPAMLAEMDDAAVGLVIDKMDLPQVMFHGITRKTSVSYCPPPTVDKKAIAMLLQEKESFNIEHAQRKILQMSCLKSISQSEWFHRQLQSYIQIYHPDCPFRIAESKHLSGLEPEAGVFAKHSFQRGQTIEFLSGVCVSLTKKEELEIERSEKDFSLLQSSQFRAVAMFLGPARFVNHDCKANSEIVRAEKSRAHIVALKKIDEGEEITVFYGEHYFGENNYECLCRSCTTRMAEFEEYTTKFPVAIIMFYMSPL
jgi:histone-lysine N-methyltransferase SUV420H